MLWYKPVVTRLAGKAGYHTVCPRKKVYKTLADGCYKYKKVP